MFLPLLLLTLQGVWIEAFSQVPAAQFPVSFSFTIRFDPEGSSPSNEMLKDIAADAVKNLGNTRFILHYGLQGRIIREGKNATLDLFFHRNGTSADDAYRGFKLTDVLFPDSLGGMIQVVNKTSGIRNAFPVQSRQSGNGPGDLEVRATLPRFDSVTDSVVLEGLHTSYSLSCLDKFRQRLDRINDYYACSFVIDTLLAMTSEAASPGALNRIDLFRLVLETSKILQLTGQRDLVRVLHLDSLDPRHLQERYQELLRYSKSAAMTFRQRLTETNVGQDTSWIGPEADAFMGTLVRYIRWSYQVEEKNSSLYREFLDRFWSLPVFESDTGVIRDLVGSLFPAANPDSMIRRLSERLMNAYRKEAEALIRDNQNAGALELLNNSRLFTGHNPWFGQEHNSDAERSQALRGIYLSYLSVASSALTANHVGMAEDYLKRSRKFRDENLPPGLPDSLYKEVYNRYIRLRMDACDTLDVRKGTEDAIECYFLLGQSIDSASFPETWQELKVRLLTGKYRLALENGKSGYAAMDYIRAARNFFEARNIRETLGLLPDPELDSLCAVTFPYFLSDRILSAESLIWNNRLDEAAAFADSVGRLQVSRDTLLARSLLGYRTLLSEKRCWNLEESLGVLRVRADRARELRNYPVLCSLLDSALLVAGIAGSCPVDTTGLYDTLQKYRPACRYREMTGEAEMQVMMNRFEDAVRSYGEAVAFYRKLGLREYGLDSLSIPDIAREKGIPGFTLAAFRYFMGKEDFSRALVCLRILDGQNYSARDAKPLQTELARKLAENDYRNNPAQDPNGMARGYTGTEPWFARFRSAYVFEWNTLRNREPAR